MEAVILKLVVSYHKLVIFCFYNLVILLAFLVFKMTPGRKPVLNVFVFNKKVDFDVYMLALPILVIG